MHQNTKVFLVAAFTLCVLAHAKSDEESKDVIAFKTLFKQKRLEQLAAVQQILTLDVEKQLNLLKSILDQIIEVLRKSKSHLESSGYVPGQFPDDEKTREYLALLLENGCILSDLLLRFPDYFHEHLKANRERDLLYKWSLSFVAESDLIDGNSKKLIDLASQEYGLKERDPQFVNPYKAVKPKVKRFEDPPPRKKKEKKKIKKGPRLSRDGEL